MYNIIICITIMYLCQILVGLKVNETRYEIEKKVGKTTM